MNFSPETQPPTSMLGIGLQVIGSVAVVIGAIAAAVNMRPEDQMQAAGGIVSVSVGIATVALGAILSRLHRAEWYLRTENLSRTIKLAIEADREARKEITPQS